MSLKNPHTTLINGDIAPSVIRWINRYSTGRREVSWTNTPGDKMVMFTGSKEMVQRITDYADGYAMGQAHKEVVV